MVFKGEFVLLATYIFDKDVVYFPRDVISRDIFRMLVVKDISLITFSYFRFKEIYGR